MQSSNHLSNHIKSYQKARTEPTCEHTSIEDEEALYLLHLHSLAHHVKDTLISIKCEQTENKINTVSRQ